MFRKIISVVLLLTVMLDLAGCGSMGSWKRKFIRKKNEKEQAPTIVTQYDAFQRAPNHELYQKHYNYAKAWADELVSGIGRNNKKDLRCVNEVISNLEDMKRCLVDQKAKDIDPIMEDILPIKKVIEENVLSHSQKAMTSRVLEKCSRRLKRDFYYNKVKEYIRPDDIPNVKQ